VHPFSEEEGASIAIDLPKPIDPDPTLCTDASLEGLVVHR
jgi:hypothetical protein